MRNQNIGYKKIAKILKVSESKISKILIDNGYTDHVTTSIDVIDKIVDLYKNGYSFKQIIQELKVHPNTIRNSLYLRNVEIRPTAYHTNYEEKIDHNYFEVIDTEEKAYWLGFLYADGYVNEKIYQIEVSLKGSDKEHLEKLKKCIKSKSKITDRIVDGHDVSRIHLYSKKLTKDLIDKGCFQKKSLTLTPPTNKIIPKELEKHFIRGYIDGDGCFSGECTFNVVGTKEILDYVIDHLRKNTTISKAGTFSMTGEAYQWHHNSKRDHDKIHNYLYKNATIYLDRKYAICRYDSTPTEES